MCSCRNKKKCKCPPISIAKGPKGDGLTSAWKLNGNNNGSEKYIGTNDSFDLPFLVNGIERMRFVQNTDDLEFRNINIFKSEIDTQFLIYKPTATFAAFAINHETSYGSRIEMLGSGSTVNISLSSHEQDSFINNTRNFGLGLSNPSAKFHIKTGDALFASSAIKIDNVANSPLFNVTNNGNVGVNKLASSDTKLLVEGAVAPYEFLFKAQSSNYTNAMTYVDGIGNLTVRGFDGSYSEITSFHNVNDARLTINGKSESFFNIKRDSVDRYKIQVTGVNNSLHYHYLNTIQYIYSNMRHVTDSNKEIMYHDYTTGFTGINTISPKSQLQVVGLPTYANNAAAVSGGLTAGAFYIRTGHGLDVVV